MHSYLGGGGGACKVKILLLYLICDEEGGYASTCFKIQGSLDTTTQGIYCPLLVIAQFGLIVLICTPNSDQLLTSEFKQTPCFY